MTNPLLNPEYLSNIFPDAVSDPNVPETSGIDIHEDRYKQLRLTYETQEGVSELTGTDIDPKSAEAIQEAMVSAGDINVEEVRIKAAKQELATLAKQIYEDEEAANKFTNEFRIYYDPESNDVRIENIEHGEEYDMLISTSTAEGILSIPKQMIVQKLSCSNIRITEITSLPDSLRELYCDNNQLTSLPELPVGVNTLYCYKNRLTSLPELPARVNILYCHNNQLTSLPELPVGMTVLNCNYNQLTSLPKLPAGMNTLSCYNNQLTSLPELPVDLKELYCDNNQLTSLPKLPAGINTLYCHGNQLKSLPKRPKSLITLIYSNNPLSIRTKLKHKLL